MKNEKELKSKFVKMCETVELTSKGFVYFYYSIQHDNDYSYLTEDKDYPLLKKKMEKFLKLVNNDYSLGDKDIETEIWDLLK